MGEKLMGLRDPKPGLRLFVNRSADVAKLDLRVEAGAEIGVDDYVASQLPSSFREVVDPIPADELDAAPKKKGRKAD